MTDHDTTPTEEGQLSADLEKVAGEKPELEEWFAAAISDLQDAKQLLRAKRKVIAGLVAALEEILRIGERHVDEATGRRIGDFRLALGAARKALADARQVTP